MIPDPPPEAAGGGANPPYFLQHQNQQLFHAALQLDGGNDGIDVAFLEPPAVSQLSDALVYNLSVLRDKVQELQPLVGLAVAHHGPVAAASTSGATSAVIQEIIGAASSMMYAFQQLICHANQQQVEGLAAAQAQAVVVGGGVTSNFNNKDNNNSAMSCGDQQAVAAAPPTTTWRRQQQQQQGGCSKTSAAAASSSATTTEEGAARTIIELDVEELLAKYTHYCQVCGKGFKRDANLRMHMRAHGDEYKSSAALLANPGSSNKATSDGARRRRSYYSCPQEGCRWNRKHAKFQPLKSVICAKNHYKRSHCPKMYVCNRCNLKHFSVLSDLRTHEKHCGADHHRWLCSCGTSFSRKDKLVGHLALFAGGHHHPAVPLDVRTSRAITPGS